jgi:hypothetical protein
LNDQFWGCALWDNQSQAVIDLNEQNAHDITRVVPSHVFQHERMGAYRRNVASELAALRDENASLHFNLEILQDAQSSSPSTAAASSSLSQQQQNHQLKCEMDRLQDEIKSLRTALNAAKAATAPTVSTLGSPNRENLRLEADNRRLRDELDELRRSSQQQIARLQCAPAPSNSSQASVRVFPPSNNAPPIITTTTNINSFDDLRDAMIYDTSFQALVMSFAHEFGPSRTAPASESAAYQSIVFLAFEAWLKMAHNLAPSVDPNSWLECYLVEVGNGLLKYLMTATSKSSARNALQAEQRFISADKDASDADRYAAALAAGGGGASSAGARRQQKSGNGRAGKGNARSSSAKSN